MSNITQKDYLLRRDRIRDQTVLLREDVMALAASRREAIQEYAELSHRHGRGRFSGLGFRGLEVVVDWDYYEGHCELEIPPSLLWSDEPLQQLRDDAKTESEKRDVAARDRELQERDRLLVKHPLGG